MFTLDMLLCFHLNKFIFMNKFLSKLEIICLQNILYNCIEHWFIALQIFDIEVVS
jgi:hypothetical protein